MGTFFSIVTWSPPHRQQESGVNGQGTRLVHVFCGAQAEAGEASRVHASYDWRTRGIIMKGNGTSVQGEQ